MTDSSQPDLIRPDAGYWRSLALGLFPRAPVRLRLPSP